MRARIATGTGLLGVAVASFMILPSHAISDITPMVMTNPVLSSSSTSSSPTDGSLTITADFTDDLSGYFHVDYVYTSPSGGQIIEGYFNGQPNEGTENTYTAPININEFAESGVWEPTFTMYDQSGNMKVLTPTDLDNLGMNADLTVSGTQDIVAPTITSFAPSITGGDMTNGPINFSVDLSFSENLSGIGNCFVEIISPSGNQKVPGQLSIIDEQIDPTAMRANLFVNQNGEAGTWTYRVIMRDNTGNSRVYEAVDLAGLSFPSTLAVTGTGDATAPTISNIFYDVADPVINEVPFGGGVVTMTADLADNMTGVQGGRIDFVSPVSNQIATGYFSQVSGSLWRTNIYLPVYAASGSWTPTLTLYDNVGNTAVKSAATLNTEGYNLNFAIAKNITATVANGGTVTSDVENDGATPADIVEATVTTPVGGDVSIVMIDSPNITSESNGYVFFGRQVSINTPTNTVEDPMTLTFRIDSSVVPLGESAATLQVTKNGVAIAECTNPTTADPDPCVVTRNNLGDGDIEVSIHTTTASVWSSGFPSTSTTYEWNGWKGRVKAAPKLNKEKAGKEVVVKFDIGGDYGLNVLAAGYPMSQKINCNTLQPIGAADSTNSQNGLKVNNHDRYRYDWKTRNQWDDTCRQFILKFTDGMEQTAYFKFKD